MSIRCMVLSESKDAQWLFCSNREVTCFRHQCGTQPVWQWVVNHSFCIVLPVAASPPIGPFGSFCVNHVSLWLRFLPLQVHKVSEVALKRDHVFVDTVGQDTEDTHAKVCFWKSCSIFYLFATSPQCQTDGNCDLRCPSCCHRLGAHTYPEDRYDTGNPI